MLSPEERVLRAIEKEEPDRVPLFELGANPKPSLQVILPFPLNKLVGRRKIYSSIVGCVRESYGMEPKKRTILRSLIRPWASYFGKLPSTWERASWLAKQTFRVPVKLGYDAWALPVFPAFIVHGIKEKDGRKLICDFQNVLYDIDPDSGDPRAVDVLYDFEKQLELHKKLCIELRENPDELIEYCRKVLNSKIGKIPIKERICVVGTLGFFETWYLIYGISGMAHYFRQILKEYRNGNRGPYHTMLEEKLLTNIEIAKRLSEIGMKVVILAEDCAIQTGPMISPELYESYFLPILKKFCMEAHKSGLKILMHTDGKLKIPGDDPWRFLKLLLSTGIDGLHPVEDGLNDLGEMKENWGDKICLLGNIDTDLLQSAGPEDIAELVKEKLRIASPGGGYIAGSDNSIHSGTHIKNWIAMIKAVHKYGRYE